MVANSLPNEDRRYLRQAQTPAEPVEATTRQWGLNLLKPIFQLAMIAATKSNRTLWPGPLIR